MVKSRLLLFPAVFIALSLALTGCAPDAPGGSGGSGGSGDSGASDPSGGNTDGGAGDNTGGGNNNANLDADGYVIPGQPIEIGIGDPVRYYSMPRLSDEMSQEVTFSGFKYYEPGSPELAGAPADMVDGALVLDVIWTGILGDNQSNQSYVLVVNDDTGDEGYERYFMSDELENGGVEEGETRSGTYTYEIPKGNMTITLTDYSDVPVAIMKLNVQ